MKVAVTGPTGLVGIGVVESLAAAGDEVVPVGRSGPLGWNLAEEISPQLAAELATCDVVVHCAADIRIGGPADRLDSTNVAAVRHLVKTLGELDRTPRLVHISSAFAAVRDAGHNNDYERSKWESEEVVRSSGLEWAIVRPSLVIGRCADGVVGRFSGIYVFLRMLRLGLVPAIPGHLDTRVDVVPMDVVTGAVDTAVRSSHSGIEIPASSGRSAPELGVLIDTAYEVFAEMTDEEIERPKFVKPQVYHRLFRPLVRPELSPAQLVLLDTIEVFLPYFEHDHTFPCPTAPSADVVLEAWRRSVAHWMALAGGGRARGKLVWARRT